MRRWVEYQPHPRQRPNIQVTWADANIYSIFACLFDFSFFSEAIQIIRVIFLYALIVDPVPGRFGPALIKQPELQVCGLQVTSIRNESHTYLTVLVTRKTN